MENIGRLRKNNFCKKVGEENKKERKRPTDTRNYLLVTV
jgi:hypothetical protein